MLGPLKSLRVLKLTLYFPSLDGTSTLIQTQCLHTLTRTVKAATETIFGLGLQRLTAVVFEADGDGDSLVTQTPFAFLRSNQLDLDGVIRSRVMQVEPHMVKHHVPRADILEPDKFVFA